MLRAKKLGFSLRETQEILQLQSDPSAKCDDVRRRVGAKLKDVTARLRDLMLMRARLERLVAACDRGLALDECPVLANLYKEDEEQQDD